MQVRREVLCISVGLMRLKLEVEPVLQKIKQCLLALRYMLTSLA
jgi:hypothetical protein